MKRLSIARPGERIPIIIVMQEQPDLDAAGRQVMVETMQVVADRSQAGVRAFLASAVAAGRADTVRSFWIFNGLSAHVAAEDIPTLAARADVALIREDRYRQWLDPTDYPTLQPSTDSSVQPTASTISVEWGIHQIRADAAWAAFNITGTGVVVANLDTGVDWQHPALQAVYRGYGHGLSNHIGNWFDATGDAAQYPIDPFGHGTHVMGSIAGLGGIGVAPGARWIAARIFDQSGRSYDSWIHAGFQWILAPGGDPALAPDVLNNSWGNSLPNDTTFQNDVRALRSAGIFVIFSNGNNGPTGGSVGSPAALPEAFAVGATDSEDSVAGFSSRGPSLLAGVRPHVVAPGVSIRSAIPGGGYADANGTSMAAPHVAGTVALMLSADPSLSIIDTAFVLTRTASPLSLTIPNNDSGYGRIDAYAAVQSVASVGAISGTVTRSDTAAPIANATLAAVSSNGLGGSTVSDAAGRYAQSLASSAYTVTASAFGYLTATRVNALVITGTTTRLDFSLTPLPAGNVRGSLTDASTGKPLSGTIIVLGTPVALSAAGSYSLTLPGGNFELRALAWAHRVLTSTVTILPGQIVTRNFALPPAPTILLVDSGAWYNDSQIGYYRAALDELGYIYAERRVKSLLADVPISTTLSPYDVVIWSAPHDAPGYIGSGDAISTYLSSGGSLFLSGQDVGYWDGGLNLTGAAYYIARLKAFAVKDDAGSLALTGRGIFSGVNVSIQGAGGADNQLYPDAITSADPGSTADAFRYGNDLLGAQSVGTCLPYRAVYLGFGFEAIANSAARREVMSRTLGYFVSPRNAAGMTLNARDDLLIAPAGSLVTQTFELRNIAELGGSDTFSLSAQSSGWGVSPPNASIALDSCRRQTITLTVSIPPDAPRNVAQTITLTARSTASPSLSLSAPFTVKTPAVALIVDDDRFYEVEGAYQTALISNGLSFDRWNVPKAWAGFEPATPSPERLKWYSFVIWFTGYDWFQPLTAANELTLTQYLKSGGRVLLSAQDYLGWIDLSSFARSRLGILDYAADLTTTLARGLPGGPFDGLGSLPLKYPYPNYSDALAPQPGATAALAGSHGRPIALARRQGTGKALFFAFPFEAIAPEDRAAVMERIAGYLSWLGGSSAGADRLVVAPGSNLTLTVVARNDGPGPIASAAFTITLPAGVSLQSGAMTWFGSLPIDGAITGTLVVAASGGLPSGGSLTIPVTFRDGDRAITFHKDIRVGLNRPNLSTSRLLVEANPADSAQVINWTLVARNTGLATAAANITALLPINTSMLSGSLQSSVGAATEVSGTIRWDGAIAAGGSFTLTYRMSVPAILNDRLYFGGALLDDGLSLTHASVWLTARPLRFYLPLVNK